MDSFKVDLNKLTGRSSHVDLHELIRKIRACKSAAEERKEISNEMANIRSAFKDKKSAQYRLENVAKLMYLDMLGYQTYFGQMEVLKLLAMPGFPEKRVGYLGLMQLLDENTEILQLAPASIKADLDNSCPQIVSLALTALGHICSQSLAYDFAIDIEKLIKRSPPAIRKKACLCAVRIVEKTGEIFDYLGPALSVITDKEKHHGLKIAALALIRAIIRVNEKAKKKVRKSVSHFVHTLRELVLSSYDPDYDTSGVTDPFLQVKLLGIMRELAVGDSKTASAIADVLAQVATNTESNKNPGNAILYECVTTILSIEAESSLKVLAINILGRFLVNRDNNIRYVALNTLQQAVAQNKAAEQAIQRHRSTIVECIKDGDITIRRRALSLVDSLVNRKNVEKLVSELISFVPMAQAEFKKELCEKICFVVHRYSISMQWHLDTMVEILELSEGLAPDFAADALIGTVARSGNLRNYAVHLLFRCLRDDPDEEALRIAALWSTGELGDLLLQPCSSKKKSFDAIPPREIVSVLNSNMELLRFGKQVKHYCLTAALKLTSRVPQCKDSLDLLIEKYSGSVDLELQSRSIEFSALLEQEGAVQKKCLERLPEPPPLELEDENAKSQAPGSGDYEVSDSDSDSDDDDNDNDNDSDSSSDDSDDDKPQSRKKRQTQPAPAAAQPVDFLSDLLGGSTSAAPAQPVQSTQPAVSMDPLDIFGTSKPVVQNTPVTFAPAPKPAASSPSQESVFSEQGVSMTFRFKPNQPQGKMVILCESRNSNSYSIDNYSFALAVPKYMTFTLKPASGNAIPAGGMVKQPFMLVNNDLSKPPVVKVKVTFVANGKPFQKIFQHTPGSSSATAI